ARAARRNMVEAGVRRDAIEPGAERPPPLPREPRSRPPGASERLLHEVFGVLERADHAVAVRLKLAPVAFEERREGRLVGVHPWSDRASPRFSSARVTWIQTAAPRGIPRRRAMELIEHYSNR